MAGLLALCALVAFGAVKGCTKPGDVYDANTATKANEHGRRLTAGAYSAINQGRDPSQADLKDLMEAEKVYGELRKFDPTASGAWLELAKIDVIQGDNKEAEENFLQFFELSKDKPGMDMERADARFLNGTAILRMGRADEANREAELALEIQPDNPTYLLFKAECLVAMKKPAEAKQIILDVLRNNPDNMDARAMMKNLNKGEGD